MNRADFMYLVRMSEHASAINHTGYRRSVAAFAALGYFWVIGCFVLAAAMLAWTFNSITHGPFRSAYALVPLAAAGLLWSSLRALWCQLEVPQGITLSPADAPTLFEALERIRKKIKGPPIHHVLLDAKFNTTISQRPRFGLFGGSVNYLCIGLPLLMTIDRSRFLTVVAHEYAHLRNDHGRLAAWIYRTRLSWTKLELKLRRSSGPLAVATQAFLRWYFPRFLAKTFTLARQDEYEADRIAGKLLGREVTGAALIEIAVKGAWLANEFWPQHWRAAAHSAQPVGPFVAMSKLLALPLPDDFARNTLRQALQKTSDVEDTHPVLRDRLESLQIGGDLPSWSARPALDLLTVNTSQWLFHFDKQWCREHATSWKEHHAYLGRLRARADALAASAARNSADEMTELGNLKKRLDPHSNSRACFERALQITPNHAGGLRGLAQSMKGTPDPLRLDCLHLLFDHSISYRWWACNEAMLDQERLAAAGQEDEAALRLWRGRRNQAQDADGRVWHELTEAPYFESIAQHDLNEFEQGEFQAEMACYKTVVQAWLVRKHLRDYANRRCYLLFLELTTVDDDLRYKLCRNLERTLDLPGPVLALWAGHSPTLTKIRKHAFKPLYQRKLA